MNILPIARAEVACYGVMCPRHSDCQRYAAVEATSIDHTIATCDDGSGGRPLYVAGKAKEQEGVAAC